MRRASSASPRRVRLAARRWLGRLMVLNARSENRGMVRSLKLCRLKTCYNVAMELKLNRFITGVTLPVDGGFVCSSGGQA